MHDYHYTKVKETDKKAYTRIMGIAMIVIGIGCLLSDVASLFIRGAKSGIVYERHLYAGHLFYQTVVLSLVSAIQYKGCHF